MKSYFKNELARAAGVSYGTFSKWLSGKNKVLKKMGVGPNDRILPPRVVRWICNEYGIDI